jgi:hypothetical protein
MLLHLNGENSSFFAEQKTLPLTKTPEDTAELLYLQVVARQPVQKA